MIEQKKHTYHFETSSLLRLKLVLTEAEKESPSRPPKEQKDVNEELALKLIASMQKKHKRFMFKPLSLKVEAENLTYLRKCLC